MIKRVAKTTIFGVAVLTLLAGCNDSDSSNIQSRRYEVGKVKEIPSGMFIEGCVKSFCESFGEEAEVNAMLNALQLPDVNTIKTSVIASKDRFCSSEFSCIQANYTYMSVDANGKPLRLSAALVVPYKDVEGKVLSPNSISIDCHGTIAKDLECPTQAGSMAWPVCVGGSLVVSPDYQGFGETKDKPQIYLCEKLCARHCLDAVRAAVLLIEKEFGIHLAENYYTQVLGYSQGGAMAVAVAHEIETMSEEEKSTFDFKLKQTFCGGGPYDLQSTMEECFEQDSIAYPISPILTLKGQIAGNPKLFTGVKYEDYLSEEYKKSGIDEMIDAKNFTTWEINVPLIAQFQSRCSKILSPDLFNSSAENYTKLFTPLSQSFEENNITHWEWNPAKPIYMFHVKEDEYVPFVNFSELMEKWKTNPNFKGGILSLRTAPTPLPKHLLGGVYFYINAMTGNYPNFISEIDYHKFINQ